MTEHSKKIGVLTFHNGPNFGGVLQAWHMIHAIRRQGYQCHAVNYLYKSHHDAIQGRVPLNSLANLRARVYWKLKTRGFNGFSDSLCRHPFTDTSTDVPWEDFDGFVVGSDVVWDFQSAGYGRDPVYFGEVPGLRNKPIFAYAASCGTADPDGGIPDYVKTGIRHFNSIGVRDTATARLVHGATGREPNLVVDPTWLEPDPEPAWTGLPSGKYLFLYGGCRVSPGLAETISNYCKKAGLKLVSALTPCLHTDKMYRSLTPFQWVGLFKHAECVISMSTLHGTAYAIKYNKPFVFITGPKSVQKISTMLERCNLTHRMVQDSDIDESTLRLLDPDLYPRPAIPDKWLDESRRFLGNSLDELFMID